MSSKSDIHNRPSCHNPSGDEVGPTDQQDDFRQTKTVIATGEFSIRGRAEG